MKNVSKRLFLFAAYNKNNIISNELFSYLTELSRLGDIIFFMDNSLCDLEKDKLKNIKNILFFHCEKHGEYDFGSYKRSFLYALQHNILNKYSWVYFVNDSVYMLSSPEKIIIELETSNSDMIGMCSYENENIPFHIQSWFFGVNKKLATSKFFYGVINGIEKQEEKDDIIYKYEIGITQKVINQGYKALAYLEECGIDDVRWRSLNAIKSGLPFLKKAAVDQIDNIRYLLPYTNDYGLINKINNKKKTKKSITTFKIVFLGVPFFSIKKSKQRDEYRWFLFDIIPVIKIKK